ncbi:hypothetical protein DL93DRAFT_2041197, partial [Clavulina sp. PMI_390]
LSEPELSLLRQFAAVVAHGITRACWDDLSYVFETLEVHKISAMAARVKQLSAYERKLYDCCPSSCCCFAGPFADLDNCPYCEHPRYRSDGSPFKTFAFLPLIPQLIALFHSPEFVKLMSYRARYFDPSDDPARDGRAEPGKVKDVFDSSHYKSIKDLFKDPRAIALLLTTDGFAPFKKRHYT